MPTYEYKCTTCGKTFDLFQSITARPLRRHECPACGTMRGVRRLIGTGGGIIFKGSGFYQTDYRSEHYRKAAKADQESVSTSTTNSDTAAASSKPSSDAASSTTTKPAGAKAAADKPADSKKTRAKGAAASTSK